jgi:threonine dehydratase
MPDTVNNPPPPFPLLQMVRPTTFIQPARLGKRLGVELTLASETFQHTGSFKFRAAYNVALNVPQKHIITASSGNFGQAMALACKILGKQCLVVMPKTAARNKIEAVREFGATVELIDVNQVSRSERIRQLIAEHPHAYAASPFDDPLVIEGNASLGTELATAGELWDCILAPVGGGGLTAGIITGVQNSGCQFEIHGAEPSLANDASRSLRSGQLLANSQEPLTDADGARTLSLGQHNWPILRDGLKSIVEVTEAQIQEAVRLLFNLANLKAEPTGALSVAALLAAPEKFSERKICCVISGGNVDTDTLLRILSAS